MACVTLATFLSTPSGPRQRSTIHSVDQSCNVSGETMKNSGFTILFQEGNPPYFCHTEHNSAKAAVLNLFEECGTEGAANFVWDNILLGMPLPEPEELPQMIRVILTEHASGKSDLYIERYQGCELSWNPKPPERIGSMEVLSQVTVSFADRIRELVARPIV